MVRVPRVVGYRSAHERSEADVVNAVITSLVSGNGINNASTSTGGGTTDSSPIPLQELYKIKPIPQHRPGCSVHETFEEALSEEWKISGGYGYLPYSQWRKIRDSTKGAPITMSEDELIQHISNKTDKAFGSGAGGILHKIGKFGEELCELEHKLWRVQEVFEALKKEEYKKWKPKLKNLHAAVEEFKTQEVSQALEEEKFET